MKERTTAAVLTMLVVMIIAAFQGADRNVLDVTGGIGLCTFWLGVLAGVIGIVVCIPVDYRRYGQGIIIGSGLLLLTGLSICTGGFGLISQSALL